MGDRRSADDVMSGWDHGVSGTVVRDDHVVHVEHVWTTAVTIRLGDTAGRELAALEAIRTCTDFFADVDLTLSAFRPLSEVSLYRNGLSGPDAHSTDFVAVMTACDELRRVTGGAFDPWAVPGGYDPSGYVKGWAAGRASDLLQSAGFKHGIVNAGGDISARGDEIPGSGDGWPVGIINPHATGEVVRVVPLHDRRQRDGSWARRGDRRRGRVGRPGEWAGQRRVVRQTRTLMVPSPRHRRIGIRLWTGLRVVAEVAPRKHQPSRRTRDST